MSWIFESTRLGFRRITASDFDALAEFLKDPTVMYAWEHGFTDQEVEEFIQKNIDRYESDGFSYFAAIEKEMGTLIGVMGPLVEQAGTETHIGIGYILHKAYWHQGFAREGVQACIRYAFDTLQTPYITTQIRPNNHASIRVAKALGMQEVGQFIKHYNGKEMPHILFKLQANAE